MATPVSRGGVFGALPSSMGRPFDPKTPSRIRLRPAMEDPGVEAGVWALSPLKSDESSVSDAAAASTRPVSSTLGRLGVLPPSPRRFRSFLFHHASSTGGRAPRFAGGEFRNRDIYFPIVVDLDRSRRVASSTGIDAVWGRGAEARFKARARALVSGRCLSLRLTSRLCKRVQKSRWGEVWHVHTRAPHQLTEQSACPLRSNLKSPSSHMCPTKHLPAIALASGVDRPGFAGINFSRSIGGRNSRLDYHSRLCRPLRPAITRGRHHIASMSLPINHAADSFGDLSTELGAAARVFGHSFLGSIAVFVLFTVIRALAARLKDGISGLSGLLVKVSGAS